MPPAQDPKPKVSRSASCNCGSVKVTAAGIDAGSVHCYCRNCQRASGSAFAHNHRFKDADLQITEGENCVREYADSNTKSGNTLMRAFCTICGCPMYMKNPAFAGFVILHSGGIDGERTQPKFELFKQDKHPWLGDPVSPKL